MTGKSDPLSAGFVASSQVDEGPLIPITPDEARAASLTLCEMAVRGGYGAAEARVVLTVAGLL